jgi:hypothetical protein
VLVLSLYLSFCGNFLSPVMTLLMMLENARKTVQDEVRAGDFILGQSFLGEVRWLRMCSKVPAHASRAVKKSSFRLNIFFTVAGREECSYCDSVWSKALGLVYHCTSSNQEIHYF